MACFSKTAACSLTHSKDNNAWPYKDWLVSFKKRQDVLDTLPGNAFCNCCDKCASNFFTNLRFWPNWGSKSVFCNIFFGSSCSNIFRLTQYNLSQKCNQQMLINNAADSPFFCRDKILGANQGKFHGQLLTPSFLVLAFAFWPPL